MSGNSVTASTIFTSNNVQGGPNDVVVNNETVQGDLTVDGTVDIGLATISGLNVEGNAQVKGDLTVGYGGAASNIVASGNISGNTLSVTGVANFNSTIDTNSLIVDTDAQIGGILSTPYLEVSGVAGNNSVDITGDVNIKSGFTDINDLMIDQNLSAQYASVGSITVTNTPVAEIYNAVGYTIASFTTPAITPGSYKVQLNNVSATFGYNTYTFLQGFQGIGQREVQVGIVQLPWDGIVDSRFSYFKYFRKQWNWNYTTVWNQTVPNETYTSSYSKVVTLNGSTNYGLVMYAPIIPNIDGIYTADSNNSTPLNYEYFFNSSTNTIQLRVATPFLNQKYYGNTSVFGIAPATPSSSTFVESRITSTSADANYRYYNLAAPYSPQYTVQNQWTPVIMYSRNPGKLSSSSTITCDIYSIRSCNAVGVVAAGTYAVTDGLNVYTNVNSTSTTTGSIVTNGGIGCGQALHAFNAHMTGGTASTSTTTGALRVTGGAGISGAVFCNNVNAASTVVASSFRNANFPAYSAAAQLNGTVNDTLVNGALGTLGVYPIIAMNNAAATRIWAIGLDADPSLATQCMYIGSYGGSGEDPDYRVAIKSSGQMCLSNYTAPGSGTYTLPDFTDQLTVRGTSKFDSLSFPSTVSNLSNQFKIVTLTSTFATVAASTAVSNLGVAIGYTFASTATMRCTATIRSGSQGEACSVMVTPVSTSTVDVWVRNNNATTAATTVVVQIVIIGDV